MSKRAATKGRKQEGTEPQTPGVAMQMMMLPLLSAFEATKQGLMGFVQQMGLLALSELFAYEAAALAGPKGKHDPQRTVHHWGSARTPLPFGGRTAIVERPRVRQKGKGGKEVDLPSVESLRAADPMPARVAEQIVLGVSTRSYARSLEPVEPELEPRGTSKSHASRALIERTTEKLAEFVDRKLDNLDLVAMFIDGIEIARHSVIVALGVTIDGTKVPLGVWIGSTENSAVATALLQKLVERGLRVDESILFVIDGGKGIRKALRDVFGNRAVVQRCQVHKMRNVTDHLPEERRAFVARQMRDAYKSTSFATAKKKLQQLISWLEKNGEDSAASSLREGLDETLTTLRLGLSKMICRTFSTTNCIENLNGTLRRVNRNVKRWQGEAMICRWVALGIAEAQRGFRRVKGYANMAALVAALRPRAEEVEGERQVA
jgi:putative transposase